MAGKGVGDERSESRPARNGLPQEVLDIIYPAIQVGALAGTFSCTYLVLHSPEATGST